MVVLAPGPTHGMTAVDRSGRVATPMPTIVEVVLLDRLIALGRRRVAYRPQTP